jgi:hypothetical protein
MEEQPKQASLMVSLSREECRQIISDAYLNLHFRLVRQQLTIEELKRRCGVK